MNGEVPTAVRDISKMLTPLSEPGAAPVSNGNQIEIMSGRQGDLSYILNPSPLNLPA